MLDLNDIADVVADAVREATAPIAAELADARKEIAALKEQADQGTADALIDRDGNLVLTFSDGRTKSLGRVTGKDGDNGATFTLDDFDIVQGDDDRTFKFCFTRGEHMHSFEFALPAMIYRGVWKEGAFEHGDVVTWGGSLWHAQRATDAKPDTADSGWQLAVKKGRDGRDAKSHQPA